MCHQNSFITSQCTGTVHGALHSYAEQSKIPCSRATLQCMLKEQGSVTPYWPLVSTQQSYSHTTVSPNLSLLLFTDKTKIFYDIWATSNPRRPLEVQYVSILSGRLRPSCTQSQNKQQGDPKMAWMQLLWLFAPLMTPSFLSTSYLHRYMHTWAWLYPYQKRNKCINTHVLKVLCDALWSLHMTSVSWQQHSPCVRPLMDSTLGCLSTLNDQLTSWLSNWCVGFLFVRLDGCYESCGLVDWFSSR